MPEAPGSPPRSSLNVQRVQITSLNLPINESQEYGADTMEMTFRGGGSPHERRRADTKPATSFAQPLKSAVSVERHRYANSPQNFHEYSLIEKESPREIPLAEKI